MGWVRMGWDGLEWDGIECDGLGWVWLGFWIVLGFGGVGWVDKIKERV
jgi:hypothetical protein